MSYQQQLIPEQPGFILDSTVLIDIGRMIHPKELRDKAKKIIINEVNKGNAKSSIQVYSENYDKKKLESGDQTSLIMEEFKQKGFFIDITEEDDENIAKVLEKFPEFLKVDSLVEDADPWLVALAMRKPDWTIVSDDGSKDTPGLVKMKQVCRHFEINCITGYEYYKMLGWSV